MATPSRAIRIPDNLWAAARRQASTSGTTVADVVREALERFVLQPIDDEIDRHERDHPDCPGPDGCRTAMILWSRRADSH